MNSIDPETTKAFNYDASADLFSMPRRNGRRQPLSYKHFMSAAEAIRYAIEEIPAERLASAFLETDESRYGAKEIHRLYASSSFPLERTR